MLPGKRRSTEEKNASSDKANSTTKVGNRKFKGFIPQQLARAISEAISCLYVGNKKAPSDNQGNGDNKFVGALRPPKPSTGIDGTLDTTLMCQYCIDIDHELDNCKWLQHKLTANVQPYRVL